MHELARCSQIVGELRGTGDGDPVVVIDPSDGSVVGEYAAATAGLVSRAVDEAERAHAEWSRATPGERSGVLASLAVELDAMAEDLAQQETLQTGKAIRLSREFDVPGSIDNVAFFSGAARNLEGRASAEYSADHTSSIRRESLGVIGSIAPWNYPLQMAVWKAMPALAAGNTIVLKPAETTPLTTLMLAEAALKVGLPPGVLNVVNGPGRSTGEALVSNPRLAMTSFTGSTAVGRHVAELAARNGTRTHLELGGKAPAVVFDDADLDAAARGVVAAAMINAGQDCTAATRAYVHRSVYQLFLDAVVEHTERVRLGDPRDPNTDMGSLASFTHRDRVAAMVESARVGGARILTGGSAPGGPLARGAYYTPTVIADASQDSEIVQREVFGPVLVVLPFDTDDEAFTLANGVDFGLAASAWTRDVFRAQKAARQLGAGTVWINDHIPIVSEMPHGGFKGSGYGKDMSSYSMEEYTQIKHVMVELTGLTRKPWHATVSAGLWCD